MINDGVMVLTSSILVMLSYDGWVIAIISSCSSSEALWSLFLDKIIVRRPLGWGGALIFYEEIDNDK